MRREERVTVQGPVKEQQPDGMSHRGGGAALATPRPRVLRDSGPGVAPTAPETFFLCSRGHVLLPPHFGARNAHNLMHSSGVRSMKMDFRVVHSRSGGLRRQGLCRHVSCLSPLRGIRGPCAFKHKYQPHRMNLPVPSPPCPPPPRIHTTPKPQQIAQGVVCIRWSAP